MTQKIAIWAPSHNFVKLYILNCRGTYRQSEKNLLSSNIFSTSPHNMVNFGQLATEIVSLVWGIPANFNGFHVLASLLQRRRSTKANQTLHNVWPLPGLVDYIYTLSAAVIHFASSKCCALLLAALLHRSRAVGTSQTLCRWAQGATYIRQGDHHVGHWPTF